MLSEMQCCLKLESVPPPRHCEPTGRANARPMTGSAKQSIAPQGSKLDCFVAYAPRNDVERFAPTRWLANDGEREPAFAGDVEKSLPRIPPREQARQHRPIGAGAKTLQQVHHAGVIADQDARRVFL